MYKSVNMIQKIHVLYVFYHLNLSNPMEDSGSYYYFHFETEGNIKEKCSTHSTCEIEGMGQNGKCQMKLEIQVAARWEAL